MGLHMSSYSRSSSAHVRAAAADSSKLAPAEAVLPPPPGLEMEPDAMLPAEQISALVVTEKEVVLLWAAPNLPPENEIVLTPAGSVTPLLVSAIVVRPAEGESAVGALAEKVTQATEEVNEVAIFAWVEVHPVDEKTAGGTTKKPVL